MRDRIRQVPLGLWIVLILGIELRVALTLAYDPTPLVFYDSLVYVGMAGDDLFTDPSRTIGYPLILRTLHALSSQIEFTIAVQHLLGICTGLLVYGTFRRIGTPVWVAVVGGAGVLLSLDQVFLEHSLLSETPFTLAIAAMLYVAVRALEEPRPAFSVFGAAVSSRGLWIVAAGLSLGVSAWIRPLGVPLALLLALWFALAIPGNWRVRIGRAAIGGATAIAVMLAYAGFQAAENGHFGFSRATGWTLYSRTAQFADCDRFDPPAGTEALCEDTPPEDRNGPDFYAFEPGSPARQMFGEQPNGDEELGAFASAALFAQPFDYLRTATIDSLRYFRTSLGARPYGGVGYDVIDIDRRAPGVEEEVDAGLDAYYADDSVEVEGLTGELADLQDVLRLQPWLMSVVAVFSLIGVFLARGRVRAGLLLALGVSAALLVIPPVTAIWSARYAVPVTGPLVGCAAAGVWLLAARFRTQKADPEAAA